MTCPHPPVAAAIGRHNPPPAPAVAASIARHCYHPHPPVGGGVLDAPPLPARTSRSGEHWPPQSPPHPPVAAVIDRHTRPARTRRRDGSQPSAASRSHQPQRRSLAATRAPPAPAIGAAIGRPPLPTRDRRLPVRRNGTALWFRHKIFRFFCKKLLIFWTGPSIIHFCVGMPMPRFRVKEV